MAIKYIFKKTTNKIVRLLLSQCTFWGVSIRGGVHLRGCSIPPISSENTPQMFYKLSNIVLFFLFCDIQYAITQLV